MKKVVMNDIFLGIHVTYHIVSTIFVDVIKYIFWRQINLPW